MACPSSGKACNIDTATQKKLATKAKDGEALDMHLNADGSWTWVSAGPVRGCDGDTEMTEAAVRDICVQEGLYREPENNDKLPLAFKGFTNIGGLEAYKNVKSLDLQGNGLKEISGLESLVNLVSINLSGNQISRISGLGHLKKLGQLHLSSNAISELGGLEQCEALESLHLKSNRFVAAEGLQHLTSCKGLKVLDISSNRIEQGGEELLALLAQTDINCLYIAEVPCVREVSAWRKTFIGRIRSLTYLLDKPVEGTERRLAEAWVRGGAAEEEAERAKMNEEKKKKKLSRPGMFGSKSS